LYQTELAGVESAHIGCVILDVHLPGMTGLQLRDLMAERGISLPIVFLTGHGDVPMSVDAMKKGRWIFCRNPRMMKR
jgi:FixJ family two-component response regulator